MLAVKRVHGFTALAHVVTLLWGYRLALWLLPFRWVTLLTVTQLTPWAEHATALPEAGEREQRRVARMVKRAAAFVPHATCLVRVLTGAHLFAARGKQSQIVIGVRRRAGRLEAHAWLESGGRVVLGDVQDLPSYQPLS